MATRASERIAEELTVLRGGATPVARGVSPAVLGGMRVGG